MTTWHDSLLGRMDWGNWIYGLFAAFIGGGATSVSTALVNLVVDPKDFALFGPKSLHVMWVAFLINGAIVGFAFLKQSPLPAIRTVTVTTTESVTHAPTSPTVVKTKVEETTIDHA